MMKITPIEEEIKAVTKWRSNSNEYQLKIFDLLFKNETEELWCKLEYYRNSPDLQKYKDMSFRDLLKDVFNFSHSIYCKMRDRLRNIQNWRTLYIIYGWDGGMACFINRSQNERSTILNAIASGDKRPINTIWRHHFPHQKDDPNEADPGLKAKYAKLEVEHTKLKKAYGRLNKKYIELDEKYVSLKQKLIQIQKLL